MEPIARTKVTFDDKLVTDHLWTIFQVTFEKRKRKKKGKFRKNSKSNVKLTEEDLEYLVSKTKFSKEEITEWHRYKIELLPSSYIVDFQRFSRRQS